MAKVTDKDFQTVSYKNGACVDDDKGQIKLIAGRIDDLLYVCEETTDCPIASTFYVKGNLVNLA